MALDKIKMSQLHEQFLAELTGGRKTKGSGSQWPDQMDARAHRFDVLFAVASDGKATLGQSITVSRAMLEKAIKQAGGERPLLGLRFYLNERLDVGQDWIVIRADDFGELLEKVNHPMQMLQLPQSEWTEKQIAEFQQHMKELLPEGGHEVQTLEASLIQEKETLKLQLDGALQTISEQSHDLRLLGERPTQDEHRQLMGQYARAEAARREAEVLVEQMKEKIAAAEAESPLALATQLGALQQNNAFQAQIIAGQRARLQAVEGRHRDLAQLMTSTELPPSLPWVKVFKEIRPDGKPHVRVVSYDENGAIAESEATSDVRVEPLASGGEQMIVNGTRVKQGDLYVNGRHTARVGG